VDTVIEILKVAMPLLWFIFVVALVAVFYKPIRDDLVPRLCGLKAMGVEFSFIQESMDSAIELAEKTPEWRVDVPERDKERALRRARQNLSLFVNTRFLWADDVPRNNRNERRMFRNAGVTVDIATSTQEALDKLDNDHYDIVISDIARGEKALEGLEFLRRLREHDHSTPVIFYIGNFDPQKGVPLGAFGITNRPDELLHLTLDALERNKT
jgi:CheY-like chemotaxis protein